ncbi:hypothetical protein GP486_005930 [Trichoglossum hirsutum]|uniref:Uncharacterized protein n=1 Tax=Trichoglossum hirsutum TaxID=265104 RepID=A0A9P8RLQ4_9PEZI|nr:hypothetical protein GP486_005930 [Trichoglossum hirsutum]
MGDTTQHAQHRRHRALETVLSSSVVLVDIISLTYSQSCHAAARADSPAYVILKHPAAFANGPLYTSQSATMSNMTNDPEVDEFAQTRAPDDLFDDDFTPVTEPTALTQPQPTLVPSGPRASRGEQSHRGGRGRGRGRGRGAYEGHSGAKAEGTDENPGRKEIRTASRGDRAATGDRTATGGVAKLTESELEARLASIRLRNAALEAAHRRAEADEASFQEREQRELAKRLEERVNRRVLEGEREKNRQRKLKAVQGREWDAEKKEEDYNSSGRGGSAFSRGAHGGVVGGRGGFRNAERGRGDFHPSQRGRGDLNAPRGPRGAGRGRGGPPAGEAPTAQSSEAGPVPPQDGPAEFPALPSPKHGYPDKKASPPPKLTFPISPPPPNTAPRGGANSPKHSGSKPGSPKPPSPKHPNHKRGGPPGKSNSPKPRNPNGAASPKPGTPRPRDQTLPSSSSSGQRPNNNNRNPPQSDAKEVMGGGPPKVSIPSLQSPPVDRGTWAEQMEAGTPTT